MLSYIQTILPVLSYRSIENVNLDQINCKKNYILDSIYTDNCLPKANMDPPHGNMIIAIEGANCVGKTTLVTNLKSVINATWFKFPMNPSTKLSQLLELARTPSALNWIQLQDLEILLDANKIEHAQEIFDARKKTTVIIDRFTMSRDVYKEYRQKAKEINVESSVFITNYKVNKTSSLPAVNYTILLIGDGFPKQEQNYKINIIYLKLALKMKNCFIIHVDHKTRDQVLEEAQDIITNLYALAKLNVNWCDCENEEDKK